MRKFMLVLVGCVIGLLIAAVLLVGGLYWASQQRPKFYAEALVVAPEKQREASDQLLAQAAALQSAARREKEWETVFTAEQINGWLAVDLVENHPTLLPKEVRQPRVAFKPQEVLIGWTLAARGVETVCSVRATVTLAEPNVLAIRLHDAYAGNIPLPLGQILNEVRDRAAEGKIQLEWRQADGDPVALVKLPAEGEDGLFRRLDALDVQEGKVYIRGGVESASQAKARASRALPANLTPSESSAPANEGAQVVDDGTPLVARSPRVGAAANDKVRRSKVGSGGRYL